MPQDVACTCQCVTLLEVTYLSRNLHSFIASSYCLLTVVYYTVKADYAFQYKRIYQSKNYAYIPPQLIETLCR